MGSLYSVASSPSRRFNSRLTPEREVWVCWQCNGREDVSRVRDLSLGGIFLETKAHRAVGASTKIDFLVDEGQIRAEAIVRHIRPGNGLGLKFTALTDQDRPRLAALLRRLRH
jgi:hypothetical protein